MTIAERLAEFIVATDRLPAMPRAKAIDAVFDLAIAAIAGFGTEGAAAARTAARSSFGTGVAPVWFTADRLTVPGAAFANAAMACMLDLDDGHRAAAGHPGASVIPAVLATAASVGADHERVLTAIGLGYEVAVRIAAARDFARLDTMVSGPWVGQGAAAAAAWLRGLDAHAIAQAIAIAGSTAPNLSAIAYSRLMGNHVKEGIPAATVTGLMAVDLAAAGFTGPLDLLDHDELFDRERLLGRLGEDWAISTIYFKPYGCCRWAHAAIDGVAALQAEHGIPADAIAWIDIETFGWALRLNNELAPATLESAQYSVPFCVALAAVRGVEALLPVTVDALADRRIVELAGRVRLSVDPALDAMFSEAVPARVSVATASGRVGRTVVAPFGEPANPMSWRDLEWKCRAVTKHLISADDAASVIAALGAFRDGDLAALGRVFGATGMIREAA